MFRPIWQGADKVVSTKQNEVCNLRKGDRITLLSITIVVVK